MPERPLEYCCECDAATGKAGEGEDSLYRDCGDGPYCETCHKELPCQRIKPGISDDVVAWDQMRAAVLGDPDQTNDVINWALNHIDAYMPTNQKET